MYVVVVVFDILLQYFEPVHLNLHIELTARDYITLFIYHEDIPTLNFIE